MEQLNREIPLSKAALIAGIGLLIMVLCVPFAEFYIFPKLIDYNDPAETTNRITDNKILFSISIFLHFITIICDVVVAWALYIFLKPVNQHLSLLVAWLRLIYAALYLIALLNLVKVLSNLQTQKYLKAISQDQINDSILFYLKSFGMEWTFGLILFGIHLGALGYLVFKSGYVPKIFGLLLIIAGFGYVINHLGIFLFPKIDTGFLMITFFGELIFMIWLLIKGTKIKSTR